jgi:hypothetical protein
VLRKRPGATEESETEVIHEEPESFRRVLMVHSPDKCQFTIPPEIEKKPQPTATRAICHARDRSEEDVRIDDDDFGSGMHGDIDASESEALSAQQAEEEDKEYSLVSIQAFHGSVLRWQDFLGTCLWLLRTECVLLSANLSVLPKSGSPVASISCCSSSLVRPI